MTRTAHDARFHPRAGDKSFRKNPPGDGYHTETIEVVSVTTRPGWELCVKVTTGDGATRETDMSLDVWSDDYDGAWDYVPAPAASERDPRHHPQVGDTLSRPNTPDAIALGGAFRWTVTDVTATHVTVFCDAEPVRTERWTRHFWSMGAPSWTYAPARDPQTDPQPGDTKTWGGEDVPSFVKAATVLERKGDHVRVRVERFNGEVSEENLALAGFWGVSAGGAWTFAVGDAPAPVERDPRTDPQVGDTTQRSKEGLASDDPWRHIVVERDGNRVWVDTTYVDGHVRPRKRMAVGEKGASGPGWASDAGGPWSWAMGTPAPAAPPAAPPAPERDPKNDPQPGDTRTWTSDHTPGYFTKQATVLERKGDHVRVRLERFDGVTRETHWSIWDWSSGTAWSWAAPAPVAPAPAAWWESRGLPECLAALPTPGPSELERLDFVRAILAEGSAVARVDVDGAVDLGGSDLGTTVWREYEEVLYRTSVGRRTVTGHAPNVPGALSEADSARRWIRAQ